MINKNRIKKIILFSETNVKKKKIVSQNLKVDFEIKRSLGLSLRAQKTFVRNFSLIGQ